jgi:4-hydroxy-tetrahydrodipicolinate synthase
VPVIAGCTAPSTAATIALGIEAVAAGADAAMRSCSGAAMTRPAYRAMGGNGCISVTANVAPALCALLHRAWDNGDLGRFAALRDLLDPLHAALFVESNPIPLKAALAQLGLCSGEVRLPLTRATPAAQEKLLAAMAAVMLAEEHAARRPALALAS